jgi:ABC-2 type transport system ATP-binding protein
VIDHGKVIALGTTVELIADVGGEHVIDIDLDPTSVEGPCESALEKVPIVSSVCIEG